MRSWGLLEDVERVVQAQVQVELGVLVLGLDVDLCGPRRLLQHCLRHLELKDVRGVGAKAFLPPV